MTISTTTSRASYNGNGVTTVFSVPFRFFASSDLVVELVTTSTGASTTLALTTHYTVTGADEEAGGSLTMLTAPAVGEQLVIRRVIAATQEVDYISGESFPAETHERALDRLTMLSQQNDEVQDRSLTVPVADAAFDTELPPISASKYLRVNAAGDKFELVSAVDPGTLVVSPFIETLLDDADAAAARTTLDAPSRTGGNASGTWPISVSGNSASVTNGVYTTGDQTITGSKTFDNDGAATKFVSDNVGDWGDRTILLEAKSPQHSPGIGFHSRATASAGILKYYGPTSSFEFRNSVDTEFAPVFASQFVGNLPTNYVLAGTAGAGAGAVGTYALLFGHISTFSGGTYAGSNFRAQGMSRASDSVVTVRDNDGPVMSGTWMALGSTYDAYGCIGLFLRIA